MIAPEDHADDGSERFVVLDKLGAGGMGVVYRVRDQLDGREVALKTLQGTNARDLYRFKREFRSLCDLIHPNLCALHELHTADGDWFFTMELVHGASFIDWVRPSAAPGAPRTRDRIRADTVQVDRLRPALLQLCDAVHALHISGRLHRDLKPSNVLVEASGRVVVLDFGLVTELEPQILDRTHERAAVGTPAYMSPEQAADCPLTPASDWYSVGAMLYEALTGRRPWEGSADEVMRRKQLDLPPRPLELAPSSPPDLDALCMALLAPDPDARPDGHAVLRALDGQPSPATTAIARTSSAGPFVGRTAQLAVLHRAADDARRGGVAVVVRGASGMGKSALASRFLSELEGALALSGRCYERETVPFKTLDTLIDALTGVLLTLPEPELRAVLPRDITALRRMFPVLRRVPLIAEPAAPGSLTSEPQELRMRAWAALRWMLGQLAARRPLVLCVDDLQWGDLDSVAFLGDLISRADRPPVLVLLLYRSEEEEAPVIRELHRRVATAVAEDLRIIDLPPLATDEARALVDALSSVELDERASALVRDAGGNPLFLAELARSVDAGGAPLSLDELLRARIRGLPDDARALLDACSVAGRRIPLGIAARAAGIATPAEAARRLRGERLIRTSERPEDAIEPFHDRVRVATLDELGARASSVHRALADAYGAVSPPPHEALVDHLLAADDTAAAAAHAERAAAAAADALAFRRAAELYAIALQHGDHAPTDRRALLRACAVALTNAGRLLDAVALYDEALTTAPPDERFALERARLEQLLRAGQLARGIAEAEAMLRQIGYRLPRSRRAQFARLLVQMLDLRLRGVRHRARPTDEIAPAELVEADVLWSIASGLSFADPIAGKLVQGWFLRRALQLGEPRRIATALAVTIGSLATGGTRVAGRVASLVDAARAAAERVGTPEQLGLLESGIGLSHFLMGRWRDALSRFEAARKLLRDHGSDGRWVLDTSEVFYLSTLFYVGETRELARWAPVFLREAEDRGDVYAQHAVGTWRSNVAWLVLGKPEDARAHLLRAARERDDAAFSLHDYYQLLSAANIDLYLGDAEGTAERVEAAWPALESAQLLRVQSVRIEATYLRGRAALAAAHATGDDDRRRAHLARGATCAAALGEVPATWSRALGKVLDAALAAAAGAAAPAIARFEDAEAALRGADMALFEQAARRARAAVLGGDVGAALVREVDAWMRERTIVEPVAFAGMLVPSAE